MAIFATKIPCKLALAGDFCRKNRHFVCNYIKISRNFGQSGGFLLTLQPLWTETVILTIVEF